MATTEPDTPRNGGSRPVPDPTALTTALVDKAIETERLINFANRQVLTGRIDGIDKATELLAKNVEVVHAELIADIETAVRAAVGVINERFDAIAQQFIERDARSETVSTLNKVALDAAFAAQKEAAAEQNKSNTLAITKSETATTETINKMQELFKTTTNGLDGKIEDIKARVGVTEASMIGLVQNREGGSSAVASSRETQANVRAYIAIAFTLIAVLIAVATFAINNKP